VCVLTLLPSKYHHTIDRALVPGCLALIRKQLRETVPTVSHNLVSSLVRLMDSLMEGAGYRSRGAGQLGETL
jgi:hypothetical protein